MIGYPAPPLPPVPPPVTGWRTIETAPKDGSRFLVYEPFEPAMESAWWNGDEVLPTSDRGRFWRPPTLWRPMLDVPKVKR